MAVKVGNASINEKGTISGGKAGDQNGREVCIRYWADRSQGWVTLRCKNIEMREYIAEAMEKACRNDDIGYDQYENKTLWNNIKDKMFDPSKTTKKVETDCARLVRVCVQYAVIKAGLDIEIPDFYTATLVSKLMSTGLFEKLTASKYNDDDDLLIRGDLQCTRTKGHTWVVLTNGRKAGETPEPDKVYNLGERILRNGMNDAADVKELQNLLIQLKNLSNDKGYDLGDYGADGDFGDMTENAVRHLQKEYGCTVDGEVGPETLKALYDAIEQYPDGDPIEAKMVKIINGNCNVRTKPNTTGDILIVAKRNEEYEFAGEKSENGWLKIKYAAGKEGWVSYKYSQLK